MPLEPTVVREYIEWSNLRWNNAVTPDMPRILFIGDSIVYGLCEELFARLEKEYAVDILATSKCVSGEDFRFELDYMLSRNDYEAIVFNNGLHGWDIDEDTYLVHLEATMKHLKKQAPLLIWRNSTPIRTIGDLDTFEAERNPRVQLRNAGAETIARQLEIPVCDLYTPMAEHPEWFEADAIHHNQAGRQAEVQIITDFLHTYLPIAE